LRKKNFGKITAKNLHAEISVDETEKILPAEFIFDGSDSFSENGKIVRYEWIFPGDENPIAGRKIKKFS
jgi:hypothetical protein